MNLNLYPFRFKGPGYVQICPGIQGKPLGCRAGWQPFAKLWPPSTQSAPQFSTGLKDALTTLLGNWTPYHVGKPLFWWHPRAPNLPSGPIRYRLRAAPVPLRFPTTFWRYHSSPNSFASPDQKMPHDRPQNEESDYLRSKGKTWEKKSQGDHHLSWGWKNKLFESTNPYSLAKNIQFYPYFLLVKVPSDPEITIVAGISSSPISVD